MFDATVRPWLDRALGGAGLQLAQRGVGADQVTLAGLAVGLGAAVAIALGCFATGLVLIVLNRLCDGLDGAIARARGATDRGGFIDIAADFLFYAAIPLAYAVVDPIRNGLPSAVLLAGFVANGTVFLAFAAMAQKRGLTSPAQGQKSLYYMAGLAEGAETIAVFCLCGLWPAGFPWLAIGFGCVCMLSAVARMVIGWRALS